jgi:hypothetical protein
MATFNKFNDFVVQLAKGTHNLTTDTLIVYLTNNTPDAAADAVKADLVGIVEGNGYGAEDVQAVWSATGGVGTITAVDILYTAIGGSFGPFRYAVIYNDTSVNNNLIGYVDYGMTVQVFLGETFRIDFGTSLMTITT